MRVVRFASASARRTFEGTCGLSDGSGEYAIDSVRPIAVIDRAGFRWNVHPGMPATKEMLASGEYRMVQ